MTKERAEIKKRGVGGGLSREGPGGGDAVQVLGFPKGRPLGDRHSRCAILKTWTTV